MNGKCAEGAYAFESEQGFAKINACPAVDERFIKMNLSKGGVSAPGAAPSAHFPFTQKTSSI